MTVTALDNHTRYFIDCTYNPVVDYYSYDGRRVLQVLKLYPRLFIRHVEMYLETVVAKWG